MENKVIPIIVTLGVFLGIGAFAMRMSADSDSKMNIDKDVYRPWGGTLRRKNRNKNKSKRK